MPVQIDAYSPRPGTRAGHAVRPLRRIAPQLLVLWLIAIALAPAPADDHLPHPDELDLSRWTGDLPDYYGEIVDHRDGDTFVIDWFTEDRMAVRLKGLDTPETGAGRTTEQYWGAEASAYALTRLPAGTLVRLDFDGEITDPFGRLLAYVWYWDGGRWVSWNRELLEQGMAYVYKDYRFERPLEFLGYQARAIEERRGMWADPGRIENDVVRSAEELAARKKWFRDWLEARR